MSRMLSLGARQLVVIGLILGTVALSLPAVASWVGRTFYGDSRRAVDSAEGPRATNAESPPVRRAASPKADDRKSARKAADVGKPRMSKTYDRPKFDSRRTEVEERPRDARRRGTDPAIRRASATAPIESKSAPIRAPAKRKPDPLAAARDELAGLGAKRIVVEPDEETGAGYQCRCLAPIGDDSNYSRAFVAQGDTPLEAAEATLAQLRTWREARRDKSNRR